MSEAAAPPDSVHAGRAEQIEVQLQAENGAEEPLYCDLMRGARDLLRGDAAAIRRVVGLVVRHQKEICRSYVLMSACCEALFHAGRLRMLAHMLRAHAHIGGRLAIDLAPDVPGRGDVALWRVGADRAGTLSLSPLLSASIGCDDVLRLLLGSMRLLRWYLDDPGCEPGTVPLSLGDAPDLRGLAFCANDPLGYLLPDPIYLVREAYAEEKRETDEAWIEWEDRRPAAVWRGSTTGVADAEGWRSLPRARLCALAASVGPGLIDAGFTEIVQVEPEEHREIERSGCMRPYAPLETFQRWKYQIDIDGNSNSWPGLLLKLYSGSPVLKVASPGGYRQWYYRDLVPWVNYVPVNGDLSDLVERIEWLRTHDDEARAVGERGRALAIALDFADARRRSVTTLREAFRRSRGEPDLRLACDDRTLRPAMLRWGWSEPEEHDVWAEGSESLLVLPAPACEADYECRLQLHPFVAPARPAQRLAVFVDGRACGEFVLTGDETVRVTIPAEQIAGRSQLTLLLVHPDGARPCQASLSGDSRVLSVALATVEFARLD